MKLLPTIQLDRYCAEQCTVVRCDANNDCGMLQFRRKREISDRLAELAGYLEGRHQAVSTSDLVRRFFLDDARRAALDERSIRYLEREYARVLVETLQRDRRFQRHRLPDGEAAWSRAGTSVSLPDASTNGQQAATSSGLPAASAILTAGRVVSLRELAAGTDERSLSDALRRQGGIRCVAIDARRGIGTHWAALDWLASRLPADVRLWPVPDAAFSPHITDDRDFDVELAALNVDQTEDESTEDVGLSTTYTISLDDLVSGAIILDPTDHRLFAAQPNPLAVDVRDEDGFSHQALLLSRDGRRELRGLGTFLYQQGLAQRFQMRRGHSDRTIHVELRGVDDRSPAPPDRPARRIWRLLLERRDWVGTGAIATELGLPVSQVRSLLDAYRCFEARPDSSGTWRLDPTQPGLRPRPTASAKDAGCDDAMALLKGLQAEARGWRARLHLAEVEAGQIEERARRLFRTGKGSQR